MTSVVAMLQDGIAYLGADSLLVNIPSQYHSNVQQTVKRESKIFKKDGILFGANGDVHMAQLLRYKFSIPTYTQGRDKMDYLVASFVADLQTFLEKEHYPSDDLGGGILMIFGDEIFTISANFAVNNTADPYDAIGKTELVAIGSLYTTQQLNLSPKERILLSMRATERHTCAVAPPYWYISSGMDHPVIIED